jgi:hypothetical protein
MRELSGNKMSKPLKFKCCICGKEIKPNANEYVCEKRFCKKKYVAFYKYSKRNNLKTFNPLEKEEDDNAER